MLNMSAEDRVKKLTHLYMSDLQNSKGQALSIETLLDVLVVLYDECCNTTLRREKNISEFVEFGEFMSHIIVESYYWQWGITYGSLGKTRHTLVDFLRWVYKTSNQLILLAESTDIITRHVYIIMCENMNEDQEASISLIVVQESANWTIYVIQLSYFHFVLHVWRQNFTGTVLADK